MRWNGFTLLRGRFGLDVMKNFSSEGVVMHWNRLLGVVVQSQSLEVFRNHVDVALGYVRSGHG